MQHDTSRKVDRLIARKVTRRVVAQKALGSLAAVCLPVKLHPQTKAQRIVSTAPSITEALFALGLGDQVVGVSTYCDYPPQVAKLPKVGSYIRPDLESIVRLTPDLVVLQNRPAEISDRLKSLGIVYVQAPHGTLEDVFSGIEIIARAAGVPDRSNALIRQIKEALGTIHDKSQSMPWPTAIIIIDREQGTLTNLTAIGPDNYLNQMLEIAGGINVLAKTSLPRYPRISLETVIRENPDVILDISSTRDTEADRQASAPAIVALWAQNASLKAVRSGRVFFGTSNVLVVPGPRASEAAQMLFNYMHGHAPLEGA